MIKLIKDFLLYRKISLIRKIDIEQADKVKLDAFDREIVEKLYINTMNRIADKLLNGDITPAEARGAKMAIQFFKGNFKSYNDK